MDEFDPSQASTAGQPTNWGWGVSSDSGTFNLDNGEGTAWGWGESSATWVSNGTTWLVEVVNGGTQEGTVLLAVRFTVLASSCSCQQLFPKYRVQPVSAVEDEDYSYHPVAYPDEEGWRAVTVLSEPGYGYIIVHDDAILEFTESFAIEVKGDSVIEPGAEQTLEARIWDDDQTETTGYFSFQAMPAVEGDPVKLTATASVEAEFEYLVENVSAYQGANFTDPNFTGDWVSLGSSDQIEFPTNYLPGNDGTLSFKIYVRVAGYPGTEVELEADIFDREEIIVQTVEYAYDIYNRLVRRTLDDDGPIGEDDPTETFFSWENGQIVFQFDSAASAEPSHRYLWNPVAIDQILTDENALNEVLWALTDHLGTLRDIAQYDDTANDTTIVNHRIYDSFGRLMSESDDGYSIAFGFTGVYFDIATGHNYHRARWYDPATGRWLSEDPIGFAGGDSNLYRSVNNSPTNLVDPSGWLGHHPVPVQVTSANIGLLGKGALAAC